MDRKGEINLERHEKIMELRRNRDDILKKVWAKYETQMRTINKKYDKEIRELK